MYFLEWKTYLIWLEFGVCLQGSNWQVSIGLDNSLAPFWQQVIICTNIDTIGFEKLNVIPDQFIIGVSHFHSICDVLLNWWKGDMYLYHKWWKLAERIERQLGLDSLWCCLTWVGNPIVDIRLSEDHFNSNMWIPVLLKQYLYIESAPWQFHAIETCAWMAPSLYLNWTNAGILLIGSLGTNFREILIAIQTFSLKKIRRLRNVVHFVSASMC